MMSSPSPYFQRLIEISVERDFEILYTLEPELEGRYCKLRLGGKSPDEAFAILNQSPAPSPTGQGLAQAE
jgi:hypothetical protein